MKILHINNLDCNGTDLPVPSTIQVTLQDIDASTTGRDSLGNMHRDRVAGGEDSKRKVSCVWKGLKPSEMAALLQAIKDVSFTISYNDPYTGGWRTNVSVYAGDRSAPIFKISNSNQPNTVVWESLSVNFVEL